MDKSTIQFAICTRNDECEDLETLKIYQTLADESATQAGYIRVIDESGEDYLYPENDFMLVDFSKVVEQLAVSNNLIKRNPLRGL
jgi:hypothetical protein